MRLMTIPCGPVTIQAPIERVFALSTRVELVRETLGMELMGGVTHGHVQADSRVVWRGWKFGLPTEHHTLITRFEPPHDGRAVFQDTQERGRFAFFQHDHFFSEENGVTTLRDEVRFALPFGVLGGGAAKYLLAPHIRTLAARRFARIKEMAEGNGWREWV